MRDVSGALAGKRVGILGKGGSGKTTVCVLLARALRPLGYDVCVVDADSTNVGLARFLGLDEAPAPLIDHFGGLVFSGGSVTCPVDDPTPLPGADVEIEEIPTAHHARTEEGIDFLVLGKMGHRGPGAGCDGPIAKMARDLRIGSAGGRLVTLVDFKAGLEDSARGVITGLDWVVVIVDPTNAAVEMAIDVKHLIEKLRSGAVPATAHLNDPGLVELAESLYRQVGIAGMSCVINKAREEQERFLRARLAAVGITPIGSIGDHPSIGTAWMRGVRLDDSIAGIDEIAGTLERAVKLSGECDASVP